MKIICQKKSVASHQQWKDELHHDKPSEVVEVKVISDGIDSLHIGGDNFQSVGPSSRAALGSIPSTDQNYLKCIWEPKAYSTSAPVVETAIGSQAAEVESSSASAERAPSSLLKHFRGPLGADFNVDNLTFSLAQVRATFYPKFENEKSDQEVCFPSLTCLHSFT